MSIKKEMATAGQFAQFGLLLSTAAVEIMEQKEDGFSKAEMQQFLTPPHNGKVKEIAQAVISQMLDIKISVWNREKEKVTRFMKEQFNYDVCWDSFLPQDVSTEFSKIECIPLALSVDDVFNAYVKVFGKNKTSCYYHEQNKTITESIKIQQERPTRDRFILHRGGQEPDTEHLGKSYDNFSQDGKTYMTPIEGIMAAFRYRVETGRMMDVEGLTRFQTLGFDGEAMGMYKNLDGSFRVDSNDRSFRNSGNGPREIISL